MIPSSNFTTNTSLTTSFELISLNSSSQIRLGNILGYSNPSTLKPIETIEYALQSKPDVHIVTILAILFSVVLLCIIIVISLKKFGSSASETDTNFSESMENPTLEQSVSNEDERDAVVESGRDGGSGSGGGKSKMLFKSADNVSIKSDDSELGVANQMRKSAPSTTRKQENIYKKKTIHTESKSMSEAAKNFTNLVSSSYGEFEKTIMESFV